LNITVAAPNTYSGGTILNAGTLIGDLTDSSALAASGTLQAFGTGPITLNGGTLQLRSNGLGNPNGGSNGTIFVGSGTPGVNVTGGTLNPNAGSALGSLANVTVSNGATFSVGASQTVGALNAAGTGATNLNANTLTIGSTNNLNSTYAGVISGTGALTKAGT